MKLKAFALTCMAALGACQPVPTATQVNQPSSRTTVTAFEAGRLFAPICQVKYPNVPEAVAAAQRKGFVLNPSSGLYEHSTDDLQMRINSEKCALRFLTTSAEQAIVPEFAGGAAEATTDLGNDQSISISTEKAEGGLIRAAATRTSEN